MSEIISGALKSATKRKRSSKSLDNPSQSLAAVEDLLEGLLPTAPSTPTGATPSTDPGLFEFDSEGNIVFQTSSSFPSGSVDFGSAVATEVTGYEHAYKRTAPVKWTAEMDALFFQGLGRFGSDLSLIGSLFPDLAYPHIRAKFKKEDKVNAAKVADALRQAKRRRTEQLSALPLSELPNVLGFIDDPVDLPTPRADQADLLTPREDQADDILEQLLGL